MMISKYVSDIFLEPFSDVLADISVDTFAANAHRYLLD
jgi:hypothetical protein